MFRFIKDSKEFITQLIISIVFTILLVNVYFSIHEDNTVDLGLRKLNYIKVKVDTVYYNTKYDDYYESLISDKYQTRVYVISHIPLNLCPGNVINGILVPINDSNDTAYVIIVEYYSVINQCNYSKDSINKK